MTLKHSNPKHPRRDRYGNEIWARAPYNFVPLPERVVTVNDIPSLDDYDELTGYIRCRLTTASPLYVRAGMTPGFFQRWGQRAFHELPAAEQEQVTGFFTVDGEQPIIPASSLRGMVRNLVEIAAYAKIRWVTDEPLVFRAVGDTTSLGEYYRTRLMRDDGSKRYTPLMQAGYMRREGAHWEIVPARTIGGTSFARIWRNDIPDFLPRWPVPGRVCENAYRIWVKLGAYDYQDVRRGYIKVKYSPVLEATDQPAVGFQEAVLAYSGPMDKKAHEAVVFPRDETVSPIWIDDELVRRYRDQISQEQQKLLGEDGVLRPDQPVFYLLDEEGKLVFFGHLWLFRLPYEHNPLEFVPSHLRDNTTVDLAEAIFGFVAESSQDKRRPRAGRVAFTDAHLLPGQSNPWAAQRGITPHILGGPKPTTFQHYLTQQEPDDVETGKFDKQGQPKTELKLDHYASPPPHQTIVRGHKLYWHKGAVALSDIEEQDQRKIKKAPKQYTRIRPVKTGISFEFSIYFENLRREELGALWWALTLPGETGKTYRHKIGMGKPLGMGSVAISAELCLSNRFCWSEGDHEGGGRYARLFDGEAWHLGDEAQADPAEYVAAFEKYVLERIAPAERKSAMTLKNVERIQMLLTLLEWHEDSPQWREATRYMEIERGPRKINEYKERPVLPDPLVVAGQPVQPPTSARQTVAQPQRQPGTGSPFAVAPSSQAPAVLRSPPPTASVPMPTAAQSSAPPPQPKLQYIREATVIEVSSSFVAVELDGERINISLDQLAEPGRNERERKLLYPAEAKIKVRDLGISSKGKRRLTTVL
jgi:CRISPR-associated protein (TIGR03986 family)